MAIAQANVDSLTQQIQELDGRFGSDDFPEGTVIRFTWRGGPIGKAYSYAAIKADGLWYTTGSKSRESYTWEKLTAWMNNHVEHYVILRDAVVVEAY